MCVNISPRARARSASVNPQGSSSRFLAVARAEMAGSINFMEFRL
ncbi:Uncharacterised protein [Bordetella pertussis]|nr:Uncharacterised protein [Bordetella pertussis]